MQPQTLAGHTICITGSLPGFGGRPSAKRFFEDRGATVVNEITKNVTYLVVETLNPANITVKLTKAKTLGIPLVKSSDLLEIIEGNKTFNFAFAPISFKHDELNNFISESFKSGHSDLCV